jgi:hypothetical protein
MGTAFGGPKATNVAPPAPLFPGTQQSYIQNLNQSGVAQQSFGTLSDAAKTGLPTDVGPAFDALKKSMQPAIAEGRSNLIEKFGVAGLREGSDLANAGAQYESQTETNFENILAQYTMQASEAAANRRVQASGVGAGLASEPALAFTPTQVVGQSPGIVGTGIQGATSAAEIALMISMIGGA